MFNNQSFIEKLPLNLFCPMVEIIDSLVNGYSITITGLPGFGKDMIAKQAYLLLERRHTNVQKLLIDLDIEQNPNDTLQSFFKKLLKTRTLNETQLREYLVTSKIVVILKNVKGTIPTYLKTIHDNNKRNVTILHISDLETIDFEANSNNFLLSQSLSYKKILKYLHVVNEEYKLNISEEYAKKVLFLSGGNFSLIDEILTIIHKNEATVLQSTDWLLSQPTIKSILSEHVQTIAHLNIPILLEIGLISGNGQVYSQLLHSFLEIFALDHSLRLFPNLTKTDRQILSIFVLNPNMVISKEQIALILEQDADLDSEWAVYKAVERMKNKVKGQYPLKLKKGEGWILETVSRKQ